MTVTNHAAVGALIAITLKEPALVLPLAFVSHYVLDALPHFGYPGGGGLGEAFKHRLTLIYGLVDFILAVVLLFIIWHSGWLMYAAAALAVAPDAANLYRYFRREKRGLSKPSQGIWLSRLHHKIQWWQKPSGLAIELVFTAVLFCLILELQ